MFWNYHSYAFLFAHFTSVTVAAKEERPAEAQRIKEREGEAIPFFSVLVSFLNTSGECESNKDWEAKKLGFERRSYFP